MQPDPLGWRVAHGRVRITPGPVFEHGGLLAEKSRELGRELQHQVDVALIFALDVFLDRTDWRLGELRGRLLRVVQRRAETFFLDGIPLLHVGPVEGPLTEIGDKFFLTASRSIERLYPPKTPIVQL